MEKGRDGATNNRRKWSQREKEAGKACGPLGVRVRYSIFPWRLEPL